MNKPFKRLFIATVLCIIGLKTGVNENAAGKHL
jgi:hypothetical protein